MKFAIGAVAPIALPIAEFAKVETTTVTSNAGAFWNHKSCRQSNRQM